MKSLLYRLLFTVWMLLALASCSSKTEKLPADILSKEQMSAVFIDLHLLDASMSVKKMLGMDANTYYQEQYAIILQSHQLTRQKFEKSFNYYCQHPKLLEPVYAKVLEELSKKEAQTVNAKK